MTKAYISLGSNLGDRAATLDEAIRQLSHTEGIGKLRRSGVIETEPVGKTDQPKFLNCVVEVETTLEPLKLLDRCQEIERRLGRKRTVRWGPRTIDLDILLYGDTTLKSDRLTLPHPEMTKRRFVLEPLCELAPDLVLPGGKKTVRELLKEVDK